MMIRTVKGFLERARQRQRNPIEKGFGSVVGAPDISIKRRAIVKKTMIVCLAALAVAAAGCQKQEEIGKAPAPPVAVQAGAPQSTAPQAVEPKAPAAQAAPQAAAPHPPVAAAPGGDPNAGLRLKETPAGAGRRGKVLQAMDAGAYTYLEVEEKGQKLWIAALKIKLSKGDVVEFPDSKPMENFESKTLGRTFAKIIFAEGIRIVK